MSTHAADSHHHAAARRIHRRSDRRQLAGQGRRRSRGRSGHHRSRNQQSDHERDVAVRGRVAEVARRSCSESYPVGAMLGYLEVSEEEAARLGLDAAAAAAARKAPANGTHGRSASEPTRKPACEPTVRGLPVPAHAVGRELYVAADESAHERTRPARRGSRRHRRQRRRGPRDDRGFRKVHRQPRRAAS